MKFITAITITAFLSTQALAIDAPEPQPEPPTSSSGGSDNSAVAIGAVVIFGLLVWSATRNKADSSAVMTSPRPLVRPEGCLDKFGVITSCQ